MDVDSPLALKRSTSAPTINEMNAGVGQPAPRESQAGVGCAPRPRRFSTGYAPPGAAPSSPKLTPRVNQLRREESVDLFGREAAHERELHSAMSISQSWEDLTLVQDNKSDGEGKGALFVSLCPSPTRGGVVFRPFSPSVFKNTPSPTRTYATRRSQSPIAMRPSPLGSVKRKFELDEPEPSAKRGGLLIAQSKLDMGVTRLEGGGDQHMQDAPPAPNKTTD